MKRKVFTLRIEMDNAAFGDDADAAGIETASLLNSVASNLANDGAHLGAGVLFDSNGNCVGEWIIAEHPITKREARS